MSGFYGAACDEILDIVRKHDFDLYADIMRKIFKIFVRRLTDREIEWHESALRLAKEQGIDICLRINFSPEVAALFKSLEQP